MKRRMVIAFAALAVFGCQKETVTQPAVSVKNPNQALINQVDVLTDQFIAQAEPVNPQEKKESGGDRILNEDARGTLAGFKGSNFFVAYWNATLNGAKCSWNQLCRELIIEFPAPGPITPNPNNAYDFIGQEHYVLMANMIADPSTITADGVIDYDLYHSYAVATFAVHHPEILNYDLVTPAWLREQAEANDPNQSITEFVNGQEISSTEKQILISYMTAFDHSTSVAQFIAYSISVENAITAANLPVIQKARLLGTMSTYRCGAGFYTSY